MYTTGSKVLIASSAVALGLAVAYGITKGGALGTFGLAAATLALLLLTAFYIGVRDADVSPMDHDAFPGAAAAQVTARPSLWPLLLAAGVLVVGFGLVSNLGFVLVGIVFMLAGGVEWMVQNWSEHVSNSGRYNSMARDQLIGPIELAVGGALLAGVIAFGFSRVMLGLPSRVATVVAFVSIAAVVLLVSSIMSSRRSISRTGMVGMFSVGVAAMGIAGVIFGIQGPREVEAHETTTDLAHEDECGPEETHADTKASQTVSNPSALSAIVTYDGSKLTGEMPGVQAGFESVSLIRNNPSNVVFRNTSGEPARLVFELHPPEPATPPPDGHEPLARVCTALTEPGGSQLLTMVVQRSSVELQATSGEDFAFTVAGIDAKLEVDVP